MPNFGHPIDAMVRSFRNNRDLLAGRKRLKEIYIDKGFDHLKKNNLGKIRTSENLLEITRKRMQRMNRISLMIRLFIFLIISMALFFLFFKLFF